jgi:hypothetical protein
VGFFTAIYFGRTLLRATAKPFWYDEICTLYITRLATFAQSWAAELHGADYNPPLFYIIHRASRALFGDGQLALRLPEIFCFWLFCVCLFRFVSKRAGLTAGWIAMALPMLTGAYYYATEARPHGLILGFLGLAMVCWQELEQKPGHWGWRIGFAASLALAYFSHCYAVLLAIPFGLTEAWRTLRTRQFRWREWITLFIPPAAAVISFVPLLRTYRTILQTSGFGQQFAPKLSDAFDFYPFALAPCWFIVAIAIVLYIAGLRRLPDRSDPKIGIPTHQELTLAVSLFALPVFGVVFAYVMRGPIFLRYLLAATAGCVLLVTYACLWSHFRRASTYLAIFVGLLLAAQLARTVRLRHKGLAEFMVEPSANIFFTRNPSDPMEPYSMLRSSTAPDQPVVVHSFVEFLFLQHYSPALKPRLFPVSRDTKEQGYLLNKAVREWCHIDFNREQPIDDFVAAHHDFQLYGTKSDFSLLMHIFKHPGTKITSFQWGDDGHFLMTLHVPAQ